jgi:hypothetical protein
MKFIGPAKFLPVVLLSVAFVFAIFDLSPRRVVAAPPQLPMSAGQGFLGQWCAQGSQMKRCNISANGPFFTLTNEQGSSSTGHIQGMNSNVIVADRWQFVQGTLRRESDQLVQRNLLGEV